MDYLVKSYRYGRVSGDYGALQGDLLNLAIVFVLPVAILFGAWFA
jgi:hypothetical protein